MFDVCVCVECFVFLKKTLSGVCIHYQYSSTFDLLNLLKIKSINQSIQRWPFVSLAIKYMSVFSKTTSNEKEWIVCVCVKRTWM